MVTKTSKKLEELLDKHETSEWFTDLINQIGFCDLFADFDLSEDDKVDEGIRLAEKAGKKQIWKHSNPYGACYFVGTEKEILARVQKSINVWLKENQDLIKKAEEKEIHYAEQRLQSAKKELEKLKSKTGQKH